jgi:aryl-alcohol dehydrogenase-like predicted oxidoreductase
VEGKHQHHDHGLAHGVGILPIARGLLHLQRQPQLRDDPPQPGMRGQRKGASSSQVAFAWLLAQKPWIVPIPGTTKLERLEENLRSIDLEFTPEEWRDLNHAVSKIKLQGDRYPTDQEKQVGR